MWFDDAVFYQFYPLGVCGCPTSNSWNNSTESIPRTSVQNISHLESWIPHLKKLGITAVYFSPVFQSDAHGYDTRDYYTIDSRLGSNDDFAYLCSRLHENGIRVVLDGVFNHTGRGFWAFRDIQKNRQNSPYKDWYFIDWNNNSRFNDGFSYKDWEGCSDLVKLNLQNHDVREHIFGAIRKWAELFHIDGIRLDVAYSLDENFCRELRSFTDSLKSGISENEPPVLIGEVLFGDYRRLVNAQMLYSCTNYECYKGLYSSINDVNMFELDYSLNRQYGANGAMYKGMNLLTFADNHDVSRLTSILKNENMAVAAYTLLFMMPGTPCIYYGSEWGIRGKKENGDAGLRPQILSPEENALTLLISRLSQIKKSHVCLHQTSYRTVTVQNQALVFSRSGSNQELFCAVNVSNQARTIPTPGINGNFKNLLDEKTMQIANSITLPAGESLILEQC